MAEYYVSSLAGGTGVGSIGDPWTLAQAITDINALTNWVSGDTLWIKADGVYIITAITITSGGVSTNQSKIKGYTTTPGDNGKAQFLRNDASGNALITVPVYWSFYNLEMDGNSKQGGAGAHGLAASNYGYAENCYIHLVGGYGFKYLSCFNCKASYNSTGFFHANFVNCIADNNSARGFMLPFGISKCIAKANQVGFYLNTLQCLFTNNIADSNTMHGIQNLHVINTIVDSIFINNGTYGIFSTFYTKVFNCTFNNNGTNYTTNIISVNEQTILPSFTDVANFDYTRNTNALDGLGSSIIGTLSNFDYNCDIGIGRLVSFYADASDVRNGVDRGDGVDGTLDLPSVNNVRDGITFDGVTKEGNLGLPAEANVKSGIQYGTNDIEFTGNYNEDYPSINNVKDGISFGNGGYEGTLSLPVISNVRLGIGYGANDTEFTGSLDLPSINDVQDGVIFDGLSKEGVFEAPIESDVKNGIGYGANGIEFTGDYDEDYPSINDVEEGVQFDNGTKTGEFVVPLEGNVKLNINYGYNEEFTGTLVTTNIELPLGIAIEEEIEINVDVGIEE